MPGTIFINYRRGDDPGSTGRLFDQLEEVFPRDQLFMDVDNIPPGRDFVRVLEEQVARCDVLLAIIGKGWLDARDHQGARRLDKPDDFVRIEIASALKQGKLVIPVLVHDAQMPRTDELPAEIRSLARRNAVRLSHERFRADAQALIKAIQDVVKGAQAQQEEEARLRERERRRQEAEAWNAVKDARDPVRLAEFIKEWPQSRCVPAARWKIKELTRRGLSRGQVVAMWITAVGLLMSLPLLPSLAVKANLPPIVPKLPMLPGVVTALIVVPSNTNRLKPCTLSWPV